MFLKFKGSIEFALNVLYKYSDVRKNLEINKTNGYSIERYEISENTKKYKRKYTKNPQNEKDSVEFLLICFSEFHGAYQAISNR